MPIITLSKDTFQEPKLVEGMVNREMNPKLNFLDVFPVVPTSARSVTYFTDDTTAADDISGGTMGTPLDMGELSKLTTLDISTIGQEHGALRKFGYRVGVSKDDIERGEVVDDLNRAVSRAAYGMAKKINGDIVTELKAVSNDISEVAGNAEWSDDSATPVEDIMSFAEAMDLETTDYELRRMYLNKTNYYEIMKYLQGIDINWVLDPMQQGNRTVPNVNGVELRKLYTTELAEGAYLGIDTTPGNAPLTTYAYNPSYMGRQNETFGFVSVNQYTEQAYPYNVITEFVAETFHALKYPNAVTYRASGI